MKQETNSIVDFIRGIPTLPNFCSDAISPSELCIQKAIKFAESICERREGYSVSNTADGSVCFKIETQVGSEVWDFYPDGAILLTVQVGQDKYLFDATAEFEEKYKV